MAREDEIIKGGEADELVETGPKKPASRVDHLEDRDEGDRKPHRDPNNSPEELRSDDGGETATEFVELDDDDLKVLGDGDDSRDRRRSVEEDSQSPEDRRNRRRQERLDRKTRHRDREAQNRRRINELENQVSTFAQQIEQLTGQRRGETMATIDERLGVAQRAFNNAKAELADAMDKNDSARVLKALDDRDAARTAHERLTTAKRQLARQAEEGDSQRGRSTGPQLGEFGLSHARKFSEAVGVDSLSREDQSELYRLDAAVRAEGYDPESKDYWAELRKRAKRRGFELDEDGEDEEDDREERGRNRERRMERQDRDEGEDRDRGPRRPPVGTGSGEGSRGGRRGVYLPKEFIESCKAAGVWEDPTKRREMIKRYRDSAKKYGVGRAA